MEKQQTIVGVLGLVISYVNLIGMVAGQPWGNYAYFLYIPQVAKWYYVYLVAQISIQMTIDCSTPLGSLWYYGFYARAVASTDVLFLFIIYFCSCYIEFISGPPRCGRHFQMNLKCGFDGFLVGYYSKS